MSDLFSSSYDSAPKDSAGMDNELQEFHELFNSEVSKIKILNYVTNELMQQHFIPPHAPHFGSLWEAAVKSAKRSLSGVVGNVLLRYYELLTRY